jgi:FkbM family methyltransferase
MESGLNSRGRGMITPEDIADLTLHHMGRTGFRPSLVVIGAMDGVTFDELHDYISLYGWSGLFVEPVPEQFRRLKENHAHLGHSPAHKYENSAVAAHDGTTRMLTIDQGAIDAGKVHPCFGGMSAIYPPRNGLASAGDAATVATYGRVIDVNCVTLATLLTRQGIESVDLLCIDAEGWDFEVIRQLDFTAHRPRLIRCEYINLRPDEQDAIVELLERHGYITSHSGQNIDAVPAEYWQEVEAGLSPAPAPREAAFRGVTLVTSVFDLSRGETDLRFRSAYGRYLDQFKQLLQVDWPMIVFASPELVEMVRRCRPSPHTFIVEKSADDLLNFPFADTLRAIRQHRPEPATARADQLDLYYPIVLSKQFFLNDAAIYNPFETEYFLWVDGDIASHIGDPVAQFTHECRRNLATLLSSGRLMYVGCPAQPASGTTPDARAPMAAPAAPEPAYLASGRLFGGGRDAIHAINGLYYSALETTLTAGHLGSEAELLTMLSSQRQRSCDVQLLASDRPLATFFDRLQHGVPQAATSGPLER